MATERLWAVEFAVAVEGEEEAPPVPLPLLRSGGGLAQGRAHAHPSHCLAVPLQ